MGDLVKFPLRPIDICLKDGRPCHVGLDTEDQHWRCGTFACRDPEPPLPTKEGGGTMSIFEGIDGGWFIYSPEFHPYGPFRSEDAAWTWADANIDDQLTGAPNWFTPELRERI